MTGLKETLKSELTTSMRAKNELTTATLRMILSAITNEEVSGKESRVLTDQEVMSVLSKEGKKRKESATAYDAANRPELADRERAELEIISKYLPEELSETELNNIILQAVETVNSAGQSGPSAMGAVMKLVTPQVVGRADGSAVASAVRAALTS